MHNVLFHDVEKGFPGLRKVSLQSFVSGLYLYQQHGHSFGNVVVKFLACHETSKVDASSQNQVTVGGFQHFYHHCNVLFENAVRERFLLLVK